MLKSLVIAGSALMLTVATGAAYAASEPAEVATAQHYDVSMMIRDGNRLIAQPRMRVAAGEPGRIAIEPGDGSHFRMDFSVRAAANEALDFSSNLDVRSASAIGHTALQASPRMIMRAGEFGRIILGNEANGVGPIRADIIIRPAQ